MNRRLPLDIAPDLTLSIGRESVRVTPQLGLRLAQSLAAVSGREIVRQATEQAQRRAITATRKPLIR